MKGVIEAVLIGSVLASPIVLGERVTHPLYLEPPDVPIPSSIQLEQVAQWPGYVRGFYREMATDGTLIFVCAFDGGLHVFDPSADPMQPEPVVGTRLLDAARDVTTGGDRLYVRSGAAIEVFQLAGTNPPEYLGAVKPEGASQSFDTAALGDTLYFARSSNGHVVDLSDPSVADPAATTFYPESVHTYAFDRADGDLLLTAGHGGAQIFDVSAPLAPARLWTRGSKGGTLYDVATDGGRAVFASADGVQIWDISTPTAPTMSGVAGTGRTFYGVAIAGDTAFGLAGNELHRFDISNPASPLLVGLTVHSEPLWEAVVIGGHVYATAGASGLIAIDLAAPLPAVLESAFVDTGRTEDLALSGGLAYLAEGPKGLAVVDVSDPATPTLINTVALPAEARRVQVDGQRLYVGLATGGVQFFSLADPAAPAALGGSAIEGNFHADGDRLYVARCEEGLEIIDISDPSSPATLGNYPALGSRCFHDAKAVGNLAYIAAGTGGLIVVDVTDPAVPGLRSALTFGSREATGIERDGDLVFVAMRDNDDEASTEIVDVSDPFAPLTQRRFDLCCGADVTGNTLFLSNLDGRLHAIDIEYPAWPASVGGFLTYDQPQAVQAEGELIYVADARGGLIILQSKKFAGELSDPVRDETGRLGVTAKVTDRNFYRVQHSHSLDSWWVPGQGDNHTPHFIGNGLSMVYSPDDLGVFSAQRKHFYRVRGGAGLVLDSYYYLTFD